MEERHGFDAGQKDVLTRRGELEAALMPASLPLEAPAAAFKGFTTSQSGKRQTRSKKVGKKGNTLELGAAYSSASTLAALEREGVVRVDGVLSAAAAARLRCEVLARRDEARAAIDGGADWRASFADVLLKTNRCDLLLPIQGARGVQLALRALLLGSGGPAAAAASCPGGGDQVALPTTPLAAAVASAIGEDAVLYELAALVSEPGAPRQPVHPDNPYQAEMPLLTCFVGLQSVSAAMGPTVFLPRTHRARPHSDFEALAPGLPGRLDARDAFLATSPSVCAMLGAGDAALFDSRTLHCGGANLESDEGGATRALFYLSFRNPRASLAVGNVGSVAREVFAKQYTLGDLKRRLGELRDDDADFDPFDDAPLEAEEARRYRRAADDGQADAQFNLALCLKRGEGVAKDEAAAAVWFRKAADQGGALAQTNLGFAYYLGEGLDADPAQAVTWWHRAAAQGESTAQHNLGCCYAEGVGAPLDLANALDFFTQAAAQGHPGAQSRMDDLQRAPSYSR